ncbi:MAG TPA: GTPase domain-containing protein, partial [Planctomycetota bacterium]|nr:GTPase domain-containing protein [Planctomycetota bacterium]
MVQFNLALREINCKVVYFGPGLSGKTTNLEVVHQKAPDESRGVLSSIATESDRTLFFDFMPLNLGTVGGMKTKFQLYTVPGQVYYNSTRKLVLRGADGVVFVADSNPAKMAENLESLQNLEDCLREQGRSLADVAHVIQFNKRDLPGAMPVEEMAAALNRYGAPTVEAVAASGQGVVETFKALSVVVLQKVKAMAEERASAPPKPSSTQSQRTPVVAASAPTPRA